MALKRKWITVGELYDTYKRQNKHKRLSLGNRKLAKGVGIFNLPAVDTCRKCKDCMHTCYALQAQRQYPAVREFRNINLHLSKTNPALLKKMIVDQIRNQDIKIIRVHESGDFYSSKYVEFWYDIATELSDVKFYAYTKTFGFDDILVERLDDLENFNVINSFIDGKRNYGSQEYVNTLVEDHGCFVCPAKGCMSECTYCLTNKNVVFKIHGSLKGRDEYEQVD